MHAEQQRARCCGFSQPSARCFLEGSKAGLIRLGIFLGSVYTR